MAFIAVAISITITVSDIVSENGKYIWVPTITDWPTGESYCNTQYGTSLASIHSAADDNEISSLCATYAQNWCYIGLNDQNTEGSFVWSDGSNRDYTPSLFTNNGYWNGVYENCIILFDSGSMPWSWGDSSCHTYNPYSFICNAPTPSPTTDTSAPSLAPTSSCLDYNNETSADGNNEMRQFDDKHITNIDSYFRNTTFVSEFNSSRDNYRHKLVECVGSHCFIQCNQSAPCLETNIEIDVQNKTTLLLCDDDYSCPGASVKTQSGSMANVTVVCKGKYSCINMDIQLANISSFNLYCLQHGSCWDVNVSIDSNNNDTRYNDGIISCVSLHSCDHLVIATNSNQTQLVMYEHSEDVLLNN
eukprot:621080_1